MKRREFITLVGGVAAGRSSACFVSGRSTESNARFGAVFRKALNEAGYVEGHNVMVEYNWLDGQYDRLPALMAELVRRRVAVIATPGFGDVPLRPKLPRHRHRHAWPPLISCPPRKPQACRGRCAV
jgi:putative ABC transport system substrate-binding protein